MSEELDVVDPSKLLLVPPGLLVGGALDGVE